MAQWDCSTETVRGSAVGVSKFHRTASEEVKQAQMNALQKAARDLSMGLAPLESEMVASTQQVTWIISCLAQTAT